MNPEMYRLVLTIELASANRERQSGEDDLKPYVEVRRDCYLPFVPYPNMALQLEHVMSDNPYIDEYQEAFHANAALEFQMMPDILELDRITYSLSLGCFSTTVRFESPTLLTTYNVARMMVYGHSFELYEEEESLQGRYSKLYEDSETIQEAKKG